MSSYNVKERKADWLGLIKAFWKTDDEGGEIDADNVKYDAVTQEDLEQIANLDKRLESIEKNYTYTLGDITGNKKSRKRIFQDTNRPKGKNAIAEQVPMKRKEDQKEHSKGREIADE